MFNILLLSYHDNYQYYHAFSYDKYHCCYTSMITIYLDIIINVFIINVFIMNVFITMTIIIMVPHVFICLLLLFLYMMGILGHQYLHF